MGTRHLARLFTLFVVQLVVADPRGVFGDWGVIMAVSLALTTLRQLGFGQALVTGASGGIQSWRGQPAQPSGLSSAPLHF